MGYLLDTSILVRLANAADPQRGMAFDALATLHRQSVQFWIAPQSLIEFWNVATRPQVANGLGLPVREVIALIKYFQSDFRLASETADIFPTLVSIGTAANVVGKQIHDARLVATCHVLQIPALLTFNHRHFVRFEQLLPGLRVMTPAQVVGESTSAP